LSANLLQLGCDISGVACGDPSDPNCSPANCGYPVTPPLGWDPCASLIGDPISYAHCEQALAARAAGAPAPAPLGVSPLDSIMRNYNGPTSLGQIPGATITLAGLGTILVIVALIALAPVLGLVHS
jgi:hypothetical protein